MAPSPIEQGARLIFVGLLFVGVSVLGAAWLIHRDITVVKNFAQGGTGNNPGNPTPQPQEDEPQPAFSNWKSLIRPYNPTLGPEDAPVVMIEFSDFQCPFCAKHFFQNHKILMEKYGKKMRFVYKHFPLTQIHPQAMNAAIAAQCAHREGKFWEYHDEVFTHQQELSEANLLQWGKKLGLGSGFERCFKERATQAEVEQDLKDGFEARVRGTPTFFINGRVIPGALPLTNFQQEIEKDL